MLDTEAIRPVRKCAARLFFLVGFLLAFSSAEAHYCGPPVIRCKPGDIISYYILSDRAEQGLSGFSVFDQTNPQVAPVVYYTPVGRIFGFFVIKALQVGTNNIALFWTFPPNSASGFCVFEVRVSTNQNTTTSGNNPYSAFAGDPVNAFTGELVNQEPPDLYLGGPMPLLFQRYYASRMQADALVSSRLGNNWSHNFEWRALLGLTNEAVVISPNGLAVRFNRSGTNWVLQSPTYLPFQLVDGGTNVVFGDPRDNRLYNFDTNGVLMSISDGKGNTHTLTYTNETLIQVSDGLGRVMTFDYIGAQTLSRVSDGTRSVGFTTFEIGTELNLLRVTNTLGWVTSYAYDNSKSVGSLLTSTTYPLGNTGYSQIYDNEGRVIQQTRLGTNITRFAYSTNSFTTYVTNALGNVSIYVHSPDGHFLSLTDPASETLTISTNAQGRRAGIVDRTGATIGAGYDLASGEPSSVTNTDGTITSFTYTNRTVNGIVFRELASVTLPDGSNEQFTYDAVGNLMAFRDRAGKFSRFGYNARGQMIAATNATGGITTTAYNPDGTTASRTDGELGTITFGHDALRRATNAIASDGRIIRVTFDAGDHIRSITDERTNTTSFAFDLNNRLTAVTNALGQVTRINYDNADRVMSVTDRLGRNVSYAFDSLNQLTAITNRNGNRTQLIWDPRQRLTSIIDAGNKAWSFGYDDENAIASFSNPLGDTTSVRRDLGGFVTAITNALGRVTFQNRDLLHRLTSSIDPQGRLDQFKYEPRGLLTNTIFSALGPASQQYNDLGLLSRLTDHRGGQWLFGYSPLGRLTNIVDALNRTNTIIHDSRGRPQRFVFADGSTQTNTYDAAGNLARLDFSGGLSSTFGFDALHRVTNSSGLSLAFDAEDRVTNTVSSGINFGSAFDAGGRLTNMTYNNGAFSVAYRYDSRDRLIQVRDTLTTAQIDFSYDDAGRLTNVVRANGVNGIFDYNAVGRMTRIREGTFIDLQYSFDAAGQISSLNATAPLSPAPAASQTNIFTFDAAQQITSAGYGYDPRGRLTGAPGHTYLWNAASQLIRADSVTNTYNGAGNLLTRATASGTLRYHYNHSINRVPIVAEQNAGTSEFQRFYVWAPDGRLLYMIDAANGNAVYYYHFDLTGSTLALTSTAGALTDAYAYTPYGAPAAKMGTNLQPFTYVGRHGVRWDSTAGLYQMRARFYEPVTARFLSRDPLWPRAADPFSLNPYAYAANNPLQYIDPLGTRTDLEGTTPIQVIGREEISRTGSANIGDILNTLPQGSEPPPSAGSPINLRGLGSGNTLVLINGRRLGSLDSPYQDANDIPVAEIERVEVLKDGASSFYGSDAVSGVVNFILKKPQTEFDYLNLNVSYKFEPKMTFNYSYTPADAPPDPPIPQPTRAGGQVLTYLMAPEMAMVAAYGASIQRGPYGLRTGSDTRDMVQMALLFSGMPFMLPPRGVAFVNGQIVHPKAADMVYGMFLKRDFYAELWYFDISPAFVYQDFMTSLMMGGSGGAYADSKGYRALGIPPLF